MGQCLDSGQNSLFAVFAELGSLSNSFETWEDTITLNHSLFIMEQIAEGMAHLTESSVIHQDLAARNVLVFAFDAEVGERDRAVAS